MTASGNFGPCAHGQISQYLLVDVVGSAPMISLFSDPVNGA
jgi:hypothetical protein